MLLEISNLNVILSGLHILQDLSLYVNQGELVVVVGANGSGKSTLLRTIMGMNKPQAGAINFKGTQIGGAASYTIVSRGLCLVAEGRQLFRSLTARENLCLGAYHYRKDKKRVEANLEKVYALFPVLKENSSRIASTFSGGEQQMIALGQGLMSEPELMMIDELSLGLAPKIIETLFKIIKELNQNNMSILLIEQNTRQSLQIADRAYVLETGRIILTGTGKELLDNPTVKEAYLGL
ncbi:MAG: ABC transporter ATP-binding protein [Spirochaetales bacterium]|jgi:branched-chain amino acid transport system ATP-binding protein|nr:ABC transporter ATP-binding protein [Spirochaetales bacterium]